MRMNAASPEPATTAPAARTSAASTGASFADVHAGSLAGLKTVGVPAPAARVAASTDGTPAGKPGSSAVAAGAEKYEPVPGERYEEIVSGPRNGMFINRSGNVRDGEAFVMVKRSGREFHVYGTGPDRQVVPVAGKAKGDAAKPASGGEQPAAKAVEYRDVPDRAYDEITSGPRNGMFINRSGNVRDGQAFVLVERAKHEVHIYGTGKNRLVVRVVPPQLRAEPEAVKPATEPVTPGAPVVPAKPVAGTPTSGASVLLG